MAIAGSATPLLALDALVVDTETTGLDPAKAEIVEIAALALHGGRLDARPALHRLVRPSGSIPPSASNIHGIDDAAVADAPAFASVAAEISAAVGGAVVVGHSIGFDLAVLKREFERAGLPWSPPRTLDTRLLAEIAAPHLAGHSLDKIGRAHV